MRVPMNAPDMKELHSFAFMDQTGILTKLVSTLFEISHKSPWVLPARGAR